MKMTKRILMIMLVVIATAMGVNAETMTQKVYKVSAFNRIEVSSVIQVKYTQGSKYSVKVRYNEAGARIFCLKQLGNTIQAYVKEDPKRARNSSYKIELYVTTPSLEYIGMSGSSTFLGEHHASQQRVDRCTVGSQQIRCKSGMCQRDRPSQLGSLDIQELYHGERGCIDQEQRIGDSKRHDQGQGSRNRMFGCGESERHDQHDRS